MKETTDSSIWVSKRVTEANSIPNSKCMVSQLRAEVQRQTNLILNPSKGAEPHSIHSKDFALQASAQQLDNDADLAALSDELPEA